MKSLLLEICLHSLVKSLLQKSLNSKKSPGIDGIPNEFYLLYWDIIHTELSIVIKNIINGEILQGKQKRAIITLIPNLH